MTWAGPLGPSLALRPEDFPVPSPGGGALPAGGGQADGEAELRALMPVCCAKAPGASSGSSPPQSRGEHGWDRAHPSQCPAGRGRLLSPRPPW